MTNLDIQPIPAMRDNYIWLIKKGPFALIVDPGEAAPVLQQLAQQQLQLLGILVTHHHADHVDGIADILHHHPAPVFAPAQEDIPGKSHSVHEGQELHFQEIDLSLKVIELPGHTLGHAAYYGANALFCGDTLFGCGCGRLFEGSPCQMFQSLQKLAALPSHTQVYCAHEYTQANIRFALAVEPLNPDLQQRAAQVGLLREQGQSTVPSSLATELACNPFLRSHIPAVRDSAQRQAQQPLRNPEQVFTALRQWKDHF